eukprot:sb/3470765/
MSLFTVTEGPVLPPPGFNAILALDHVLCLKGGTRGNLSAKDVPTNFTPVYHSSVSFRVGGESYTIDGVTTFSKKSDAEGSAAYLALLKIYKLGIPNLQSSVRRLGFSSYSSPNGGFWKSMLQCHFQKHIAAGNAFIKYNTDRNMFGFVCYLSVRCEPSGIDSDFRSRESHQKKKLAEYDAAQVAYTELFPNEVKLMI